MFRIILTAVVIAAGAAAFSVPPPFAGLVVMESQELSMSNIELVIETTSAGGGHICHVTPAHFGPDRKIVGCLMIGTILPEQEPAIRALPFVTRLERGPIDPYSVQDMGIVAVFAAEAWNFIVTGGGEEPPEPGIEMPLNDALGPIGDLLGTASVNAPSPKALAPTQNQTSEFMIGRVAVGLVMPESSGTLENWATTRQSKVVSRVQSGAGWWVLQGGSAANLTFVYDIRYSVPTQYEPITISANVPVGNDGIWIADVLNNMGYTGVTHYAQALAYDNAIRSQYGTNWAFALFVADSNNDADGRFPDGATAYAYLHGPYMVMTYDNGKTTATPPGWGIDRMHLVFAHEMAHTFGAADEYSGAPTCTCSNYGYLGVYNGNCVNCLGGGQQATCSMVDCSQALCSFTKGQVGWRDSDTDGILDPVDTIPSVVSASLVYGPVPPFYGQPQIKGSGVVMDNPWPSPTRPSVTINAVRALYSVDSPGPWQMAVPSDGMFDTDLEPFNFTSISYPDGPHQVYICAINTVGNMAVMAPLNITLDTTPPPSPIAALIVESPYSSSPSVLNINWTSGPPDPESGTIGHNIVLRRHGVIMPVASAYAPVPAQTYAFGSLNLLHGIAYYADVRALNGAGNNSLIATTGNVTIDLTPPFGPVNVADTGAWTSSSNTLQFFWPMAVEDVSGISDYLVTIFDNQGNNLITDQSVGGNFTNYTFSGLPLVMGRVYFATVKSVNGANTQGAPSPPSDGIYRATTYSSIGAVKRSANLGDAVGVNAYITSASSDEPGVIYVEELNRSAGIRTDSMDSVSRGSYVGAAGLVTLNSNNELYLKTSEVSPLGGSFTIAPLGLSGRALGGGAMGLQPAVGSGSGLNNVGLLVRIWGNVTYASPAPPYYFVIDDGSGAVDISGLRGIRVYCGSVAPPPSGTFRTVTGISSISSGYPVVLIRDSNDWR